jgi:hypothetical protein
MWPESLIRRYQSNGSTLTKAEIAQSQSNACFAVLPDTPHLSRKWSQSLVNDRQRVEAIRRRPCRVSDVC